jgi:hypothetical protein
VVTAWADVGIRITGVPAGARAGRGRQTGGAGGGQRSNLAALTRQIEALSGQMKELAKEIRGLKART